MTNLYTGTIDTEGQYQTLASLTGVTFSEGDKYVIQILEMKGIDNIYLREGTVGKGFHIKYDTPITYTKEATDLYIKTNYEIEINMAD